MLTTYELQEKLCRIDEITLLELLNINSEDIVNRFVDYIEANRDKLIEETEWEYGGQ